MKKKSSINPDAAPDVQPEQTPAPLVPHELMQLRADIDRYIAAVPMRDVRVTLAGVVSLVHGARLSEDGKNVVVTE